MLMLEYRDIGWWYWLVTAGLLNLGVAGYPVGFALAIGLTIFQFLHYAIQAGSFSSFPAQVRVGYLILLLIALPEPMNWLYWLPTAGTWAQVLFGYCGMARFVSLMPWNRREPLSSALIKKTFISRPVRGSVKQGFSRGP